MFRKFNPNPEGRHVGDCTIRAISMALDQDWYQTYAELALEGYLLSDMPSANRVWGSFLKKKGFKREIVPDDCPNCYTLKDFCREHPIGTYIVALHGHVVCTRNGCYYDTWDSGEELPIYFWKRKED